MRPILLLAPLLCAHLSHAQSGPEHEAIAAVERFLHAAAHRDTAAMARTLTPEGSFHAVFEGPEGGVPSAITHRDYIKAMAKDQGRASERHWDARAEVTGAIAIVRTAYDLLLDGRPSHCGTNVFTLVQGPSGWRIAGSVSTVRQQGCPPGPPTGPK